MAELVRAHVDAPVGADRDRLGLAGRPDLREHLDVERLALGRRRGPWPYEQQEDKRAEKVAKPPHPASLRSS